MPKVKHCIDCAHFKMKKFPAPIPHAVTKFRVLGKNAVLMACNRPELEKMLAAAEMERDDAGQCGPNGNYFSNKPNVADEQRRGKDSNHE